MAIVRVGIGTDLHRLAEGGRLILGHVVIEHTQGPVAHSDGDVVLHAMIDALAGAAGLPDIGEMFPDTDPAWRGADSGELLTAALAKVAARGYRVVNVDATIHAQQPKLGPYKIAIRAEVARLLGIPLDAVSIKAKTGEGLDAVGRAEAIACTAVVGLGVAGRNAQEVSSEQ
ncbi:MAG: 2-C-methyl-D-erythritol 2,4-cyclodiphosphate synthase [Phycisphaerae bacterium]|nr:2-C-methyl-D-erythritol 2,4-cyclodiphosphate synthase [Phycisphaerae bacterium]